MLGVPSLPRRAKSKKRMEGGLYGANSGKKKLPLVYHKIMLVAVICAQKHKKMNDTFGNTSASKKN